jgi:hypothetical protein
VADYDLTATSLSDSPHLDAVALIGAQRRHDGDAAAAILSSADLESLALVLAQMVRTAAGRTIDEFLAMQVDKTLDHARDDEAGS